MKGCKDAVTCVSEAEYHAMQIVRANGPDERTSTSGRTAIESYGQTLPSFRSAGVVNMVEAVGAEAALVVMQVDERA